MRRPQPAHQSITLHVPDVPDVPGFKKRERWEMKKAQKTKEERRLVPINSEGGGE